MAAGELDDQFTKVLERSRIHQTIKAARASLAEPSRPFTPLDRSLFQQPNQGDAARPTSSYTVDDVTSRWNSGNLPETIAEGDEREGHYSQEGGADVLRLDTEDQNDDGSQPTRSRPSPQGSDAGASSGSEELTPMMPRSSGRHAGKSGLAGSPQPPARTPARPPKPPGGGYPSQPTIALRSAGGYPGEARDASPGPGGLRRPSPRRRSFVSDGSPSSRAASNGTPRSSDASPRDGTARDWSATCEATIQRMQAISANRERPRKEKCSLEESPRRLKRGDPEYVQLCEQVWDLASEIKAARGTKSQQFAPTLLREIMSLIDVKDLKDAKCLFKLLRSALTLLQLEGATHGVPASGVQAAYLNIAQVLFKYSQKGEHDKDFHTERLLEPLLETLRSDAPECGDTDLRIYVVGILKNVSQEDDANQRFLAKSDAVSTLFRLTAADRLTGSSKEAQLLVQITATLRNVASREYKHFLPDERLSALTRIMALFPEHVELLTNISRIMAKLTLHGTACEAFAKSSAHVRQIARTLAAHTESTALVLRLAFVLGNLTEKSERLRVVFPFDCEGTALVPQMLGAYWQKARQLQRIEHEYGQGKAAGLQEVEEVLVKLVRLLANIAITASAGTILASSSAVVDPLLDMLGVKKITESEELVLNVVSAITNLLFYDVPSNLLFQEDNKQLLCRLFRPLLLESYNVEALVETARALGNLSRHADARRCMGELRLDEILVILLEHDERDLVFYVCGALVNLAAEPSCSARLLCPILQKLSKLLSDVPVEDPQFQHVAIKVLTNLSLDPSREWPAEESQALREVLAKSIADHECAAAVPGAGQEEYAMERQQLLGLSRQLLGRLPAPAAAGVTTEENVTAHMDCRHAVLS